MSHTRSGAGGVRFRIHLRNLFGSSVVKEGKARTAARAPVIESCIYERSAVQRGRGGVSVNIQARQQTTADTDLAATDAQSMEERVSSARVAPFPGRAGAADGGEAAVGRRRVKGWLVAILAVIVAGVVWATMRDPAGGAGADGAAQPLPPLELASVDVAVVEPRVLTRVIPLSGTISPLVQATVKAKVSGEVEAVTVREGQNVAAGDVIARIDSRHLRAEYERELAAVEKARADLELATLNRDKNRTLLEQRYISQNTFEQTETAYAGSVANLKLAEAQARLAKIALDDAVVRAPFSGTIARRLVEPGEKVSPDSAIVMLVDLKQMQLEAAVPAMEIPSVEVGQVAQFKVGGFGERLFEGTVQRINPITEDGSRAINIYIAVDNPDNALKGGMFAQGKLQLSTTDPVLAVPQQALHQEAGMWFVHTLEGDKIGRKQVTIGTRVEGEGYAEIRSGLQAGERVIVADIGDRKPGAEARLVAAE